MSSPPVYPAARKGDRITHGAVESVAASAAALGAAIGALVSHAGLSGSRSARVGIGIASGARDAAKRISLNLGALVPIDVTGVITIGSPDAFFGGPDRPAALAAAQPVDCRRHRDKPVAEGSASVVLNGRLVARVGDPTACGARIVDGDASIRVGGPPTQAAPAHPRALSSRNPSDNAVSFALTIAARSEPSLAFACRYAQAIGTALNAIAPLLTGVATNGREGGARGAERGADIGRPTRA